MKRLFRRKNNRLFFFLVFCVSVCSTSIPSFAVDALFKETAPQQSHEGEVRSPGMIQTPVPFSQGEKITYDIKKMGVRAGEATLVFEGTTEIRHRPALLIVFTARALNFFDEEKIYLDPLTFYPVFVQRRLNIWGKKEKIEEEYLPQEAQIKITKTAGGQTTEQIIEKAGPIENIYGFIYRCRKDNPFNRKDPLEIKLPTKDLSIEFVREGKLKAAGQAFDVYFMQSDPRQYSIWFDAGSNRIPLRIDGAVGFGKTSMIMVEYKKGNAEGSFEIQEVSQKNAPK